MIVDGTVRLADFGLGRTFVGRDRTMQVARGGTRSTKFVHIEQDLRKGIKYDAEADISSFVCLLYDFCMFG